MPRASSFRSSHLTLLLVAVLMACTGLPALAGRFSKVVIDPGHGGHDNGGRIGYVFEKHLALDVSLRLERYLNGKGIRTELTRRRDVFVPLEDRSAMANRISNSIFVSIHFNWVSYGGPSGTETWYCGANGHSLAASIQNTIAQGLGTPSRGVKQGRFKVIRTCSRPCALIEGGFISTGKERARILDPRYRQRLAELIGDGILRYRRL
jgi:N-acetylmuramoyl-L-alanine amidase